jgi:hypothetical protein
MLFFVEKKRNSLIQKIYFTTALLLYTSFNIKLVEVVKPLCKDEVDLVCSFPSCTLFPDA